MSTLGDIFKGSNNIDFPKMWKTAAIGSLVLILISLGAFFFRGLNLGIDFEGGTSFEVLSPGTSVAEARDFLADFDADDAKIQIVDEDTLRIRSDVEDPDLAAEIRTELAALGEVTGFESVGPTWGEEITEKATRALLFFFAAIAIYISVRLEWRMAIGALVAVIHDLIISVGIYSVFQFEVTPATVIAFLTIMGYSLYDTIVVYDKVHEVTGRVGATGKYTYTEMMNLALNRVIMRSLNTTITSVLPVLSMLLIGAFLLGAVTLQEFAIALLVGLIVGGYSSLFVASSLVAWLKEKEPRHTEVREKLEARGLLDGTRTVDNDDAVLGTTPRRSSGRAVKTASAGTALKERPAKPASEAKKSKKSDKADKADKANKADKAKKADKVAETEKSSKAKKASKADEASKAEKSDKPEKAKKPTPPTSGGAIPPRPRKKKKR